MTRPSSRLSKGWLFLLLVTLAVACAGKSEIQPPFPTLTPFPPDIYIGLSDSANPLADIVENAFETMADRRAPVFLAGNDETLLHDVQQGELKAAIVYYLPADSQLWYSPVALDGVAMITHPGVGVDTLTSGQLQGILAGSINNWVEVGGPDLAIKLVAREPGSAAREIVRERIMRNARLSGLARIVPTDDLMKQEVLNNEGAIGFAMMGSVDKGSVSVDGTDATIVTVSNQSYPLTSPIYFVSLVEPEGPWRDFLAWIQSAEGQQSLGVKYGMVR